MVTRNGAGAFLTLVMAVALAGCAAHGGMDPSADATGTSGRHGDASGTMSQGYARPRLSDFVVHEAIHDVHFAFDSYDIRSTDAKTLDASAQWLRAHPDAQLVIEGHADERGTNEYNLALGERRAKASMNYLVSRGIQSGRIMVLSYGEERGTCHEKTEACWGQNRRAHFLVKGQ